MDCDSNAFVNGGCNYDQTDWYSDSHPNSLAHKRKRYENGGGFNETNGRREEQHLKSRGNGFIQIVPNKGIFHSERWKPNGSTLYYPIASLLLVNFEKYDQISFDDGLFFIGDSSGGCLQKERGHVIHCWRFDDTEKTLFIAMSFLFTHFSVFQDVVNQLSCA